MIINNQENGYYNELIRKMAKFRIILRNYFYDNDIIQIIINELEKIFDTFSIVYIESEKTIQLKLKKTSMYKNSHISNYYYNATLDIFKKIFFDNLERIKEYISNSIQDKFECKDLIENVSILGTNWCVMVYNIITISDNIVNICL